MVYGGKKYKVVEKTEELHINALLSMAWAVEVGDY